MKPRALPFSMNLVAGDVRRLHFFRTKKVRVSSRRLLPFKGAKREISFRRILALAVAAILCAGARAFAADDPRLDPLWERLSETRHPAVVHAGSAHEGTATAAEVEAVGRVARRWPRARIILAHFGAPAVEKTLSLLRAHENLYADLCPVVADPVPLSRAAIAGLERRILFGSDVPSVAVTIEDSIARVKAWHLDPADEGAVLGGTAAALLENTPGAAAIVSLEQT